MKLLGLLLCVLLLSAGASAYLLDPATSYLTGQNISASLTNITESQLRNNASFLIVGPGGLNYLDVPWYDNGDSTFMTNVGGSDDLHNCYPSPGSSSTVGTHSYVAANLGYNNQSHCIVTDEWTRHAYDLALNSHNDTILDAIVNTVIILNDSGNTYGSNVGGVLPEWVAYFYYNSTSGRWEIKKTNVADTAFDADAYAGLTLRAINVSTWASAATRAKAGARFNAMCNQSITNEFRTLGSGGLKNRVNPSQNITYLPCGGQNVCQGFSSTQYQITYNAYFGPILEYLAACRSVYGDAPVNYSKYAEDTFQVFLIAGNYTGARMSVGPGLAWHWENVSVGQMPWAKCDAAHDQACSSNGDNPPTGTILGTNWADSLRAVNVCRAAWVWKNYTGRVLQNSTEECRMWASISGNTDTAYCYNYDAQGAVWGGCDGGFRGVGLGMSLFFLHNNSRFVNMANTWKSSLTYNSGQRTFKMGSQNSLGIYDKSFGITDMSYAIGNADLMFNGSAPSGSPPPSDTTKPSFIASSFSCSVQSTTIHFLFSTDELAVGGLNYSTTAALGTSVVELGAGLDHDMVVTGLTANTTYFWNVSATDTSGNYNKTGNVSTGRAFNCTTLPAGQDINNITIYGATINDTTINNGDTSQFNVTIETLTGTIGAAKALILAPNGTQFNLTLTPYTIPASGAGGVDRFMNNSFCVDDQSWGGYNVLNTSICALEKNTTGNLVSADYDIETNYPMSNVTTIIKMNYTSRSTVATTNNKVYPTQLCTSLGSNNRFNMERKNSSHWCLKADRSGYSGGGNCWAYNSTVVMNFTTDNYNNLSQGCINGVGCTDWEPFTRQSGAEDCVAMEFTNLTSGGSAVPYIDVYDVNVSSGTGSSVPASNTSNYHFNYTSVSNGNFSVVSVWANNSIGETYTNTTTITWLVGNCPGDYLTALTTLTCTKSGCIFTGSVCSTAAGRTAKNYTCTKGSCTLN